ncbi:hypothetical protein [uncultured Kordia sp.]|uniref:hypothetical protein n=1 Tax=uncultured Kordia sp. TaxID=507699 RepID=UPI002610CC9D|nr:hypothetical protein [uncultured Kordia sp.]
MKIATIIVHKNLSKEDRVHAINAGIPLEIDVIDDYSTFRNKSVSFDMVSDYLQKDDTKSVEALIAVNNIASYELNKDSILVKILQKNGQFTLKALQVPNPYDESIEVDNHTIVVVFKTLNTNISNPNKLDETRYEVDIASEIDEAIIGALAIKGITLSGVNWKDFNVIGNCIVSFEAIDDATSFYGNNQDGFLIV